MAAPERPPTSLMVAARGLLPLGVLLVVAGMVVGPVVGRYPLPAATFVVGVCMPQILAGIVAYVRRRLEDIEGLRTARKPEESSTAEGSGEPR